MERIIRTLSLALLALCFSGCSSVVDSKYYSKRVRLDSMKRAYVVHDPASTYGCANAAEKTLRERGLTVTSGFIQNKPADADFYIELTDRWQWDVGMFLASLEIRFIDNATGEMIAIGNFHQSTFFHTFPDAKQKTSESRCFSLQKSTSEVIRSAGSPVSSLCVYSLFAYFAYFAVKHLPLRSLSFLLLKQFHFPRIPRIPRFTLSVSISVNPWLNKFPLRSLSLLL